MSNRFFVSLLFREDGSMETVATPDPGIDVTFWAQAGGSASVKEVAVISPPLPAFLAWRGVSLIKQHASMVTGDESLVRGHESMNRWHRRAKAATREMKRFLRGTPWRRFRPVFHPVSHRQPDGGKGGGGDEGCQFAEPSNAVQRAVREELSGRVELFSRFEMQMFRRGLTDQWPVVALLYWLHRRGDVQLLPGISCDDWGRLKCNRCGGYQVVSVPCSTCGWQSCPRCSECDTLGSVCGCDVVILCPGEKRSQAESLPHGGFFQLPFALTPAQENSSRELRSFVQRHLREGTGQKRHLLWAVCGAGKTEVAFGAIDAGLAEGVAVLYAVPRRDVVLELKHRFETAFAGVTVTALCSGSSDREPGDITLATTHQVMKFYRAFRLVVLDEVDAYPYRGSRMLRQAVARASSPTAAIVYLTATPDEELWEETKTGQMGVSCIPVRPHGKPLPVPEVEVVAVARRYQRIQQYLQEGVPGRRTFIFVSTVATGREVARKLEEMGSPVPFTCSSDPERDKKVAAFRRGNPPALVTTTILERGLTIPEADVLVFDADRLFDQASLIQMAGRVGRSARDPGGRCIFFCSRQAGPVVKAVEMIRELNSRAENGGYLR